MNDLIGQIIGGRYHIEKLLGAGGMALVYKAYDDMKDEYVAIKFIKKDSSLTEDDLTVFYEEAKKIARLDHPNIIAFKDYNEYNGMPYIVMELIEDQTLKKRMMRGFTPEEAAQILVPVAEGLDYAHQNGIVHRDVTPGNIMFRSDRTPVIADFGIAMDLANSSGKALNNESIKGTPEYMSPEQCLGKKDIDGRSDEYSLAIIFYEMVTGERPFDGDNWQETTTNHRTKPYPEAQNLTENVNNILRKALAKDPNDRYPTIGAFAAELRKLISEPEAESDPDIDLDDSISTMQVQPIDAVQDAVSSSEPDKKNPDEVESGQPQQPESADAANRPEKGHPRKKFFPVWIILILALMGTGIFALSHRNAAPFVLEASATEETIFFTETMTNTPVMTETPVYTQTMTTQTMTDTPVPAEEGQIIGSCPYPAFHKAGDVANIAPGFNLGIRLRESPGGSETGIQAVRSDNSGNLYDLKILEGPVCAKNIVWYKVSYIGYEGWIAETDVGGSDKYYLEKAESNTNIPSDAGPLSAHTPVYNETMAYTPAPVNEGQMIGSCPYPAYRKVGDVAHIAPGFTLGIRLRESPAGNATGIQAERSDNNGNLYDLEILDGPVCVKNIVWYKVSYLGYEGWIAETDVNGSDKYYLETDEDISSPMAENTPTVENQ